MSAIEVRAIQDEEMLEIMYRLPAYAFSPTPPLPDKTEIQEKIKQRQGNTYYAVFEDGKPVTTVGNMPMSQNIRGKCFPASGIFDVASLPQARRKGYVRKVMGKLFAELQSKGCVVSCLYPFRNSFYERLGYITFPQARKAIFEPSQLEKILKLEIPGSIEFSPFSERVDVYRTYIRDLQKKIHGMAVTDYIVPVDAKRDQWLATAHIDGKLQGLMLYTLQGDSIMQFLMCVIRFYYTSSPARFQLLKWIARHIDQASRVELRLPPFEYPETWASDLRYTMAPTFVAPMSRVLDVSMLTGMQSGAGRITIQLKDDICPWNTGTWQLESVDGLLQVTKAKEAACELSIQGLSALVYGTHPPDTFEFFGWGKPNQQQQDVLQAIFPPAIPYLHEYF